MDFLSVERFGPSLSLQHLLYLLISYYFLHLTNMVQLMMEEKRPLCWIACSQQVLYQHVTTTKQNREELFFSYKNKQGSLLLPHWLATEDKENLI